MLLWECKLVQSPWKICSIVPTNVKYICLMSHMFYSSMYFQQKSVYIFIKTPDLESTSTIYK